jgi:eukaryotic-like serine/threonine-protein kinase
MTLPLYAGRYQLDELLGLGGMGVVYRAIDRRTGGTVAVKVFTPALAADPEYLERLRREARITASLTSPRVVRVIDLDEHDGAPFLLLEYVAGPTLHEVVARHSRLPVHEAVTICREVALALEAAHARGIVHRDLKPENIKLVDGQVKVLDFGVARAESERGVTLTGIYLGTPHYSAPGRIAGRNDIRSDIYAVGAILFELLAGTPRSMARRRWRS